MKKLWFLLCLGLAGCQTTFSAVVEYRGPGGVASRAEVSVIR